MKGERKQPKVSPRQLLVLEYIDRHGGTILASQLNDLLAGQPASIRSMFSKGLISGDAVPARNVSITDIGRIAIPGATR